MNYLTLIGEPYGTHRRPEIFEEASASRGLDGVCRSAATAALSNDRVHASSESDKRADMSTLARRS